MYQWKLQNNNCCLRIFGWYTIRKSAGTIQGNSTGYRIILKQGSNRVQNRVQKKVINRVQSVFKINGLEKQIIFFLYLDCLRNNSLASLPYKRSQIVQLLDCKLESYRTSIRRLKLKGLIAKEGMSGRYGGTTFELTKEVFNEIKLNETWFKQGSQQGSYTTSDLYLRFKNNIRIPDNLKTKISRLISFSLRDSFFLNKTFKICYIFLTPISLNNQI